MEKKTPRLQFRDDERSSPAVSRAADRATRAADLADKAKEKLPCRRQESGTVMVPGKQQDQIPIVMEIPETPN